MKKPRIFVAEVRDNRTQLRMIARTLSPGIIILLWVFSKTGHTTIITETACKLSGKYGENFVRLAVIHEILQILRIFRDC